MHRIFDWLNSIYQTLILLRKDTALLKQMAADIATMKADIAIIKDAVANGPPPPTEDVAALELTNSEARTGE